RPTPTQPPPVSGGPAGAVVGGGGAGRAASPTVTTTSSPEAAAMPGSGVWRITRPARRSPAGTDSVRTWTSNPRFSITRSAEDSRSPTTSGTVSGGSATPTTTRTGVSLGTSVPGAGSRDRTVPASSLPT